MANSKTLNTRIKQKRDTSANWELKNPVLLNGEIIIVDTASGEMRTKTGDGEKTYTQLPFDDEGTKGGKSLSTNDYTDVEKAEVAKIKDKVSTSDVYTKSEINEVLKNNRPSKSVPIDPSIVSELMSCGVSYLNHKDSFSFTDSGKGTFFDEDFSIDSPKIDCSSLGMALVMGIPYEYSKYVGKNNSKHYEYGIKLPTNPYASERPNRYYTHELAHYFDEQGWCFIPDKNYSDIAPGDIIFVSFKNRDGNSDFHDNAYMKIDHCLFVLGYKDDTHLICFHTSEQYTIHFYDVCVAPSEYDSTSTNNYNDSIKLVARLPFKQGNITEKPIFVDSTAKTTTSTTNGLLATINLDKPLKKNTTYTLLANVKNAFTQTKPSANNYFGIRASYADGTADETIFSWAKNIYPEDDLYRCHFVTGNKEIITLKLYILTCTVAGHQYKWSALYEGAVSTTPYESDLSRNQSDIVVIDNLESTSTTNPLSANQGRILNENKVGAESVLTKTNTTEFTPTQSYHPATKKYVDDKVGDSANYIFSDQFKTDGSYVAIDGANETVRLDLADIFNGNSYTVATPSDADACITYQGDGDTAMLDTGTSTQIISSKSGKLVSLPFGIEYTQGMDVAEYDSVDILSLHKGEYVDKDGKLYTYKNINALANATSAANFSAMGRDSNKAAIATPTDGLTAICFRRDATGYNAYSAIYNYWKENTDKNGLKYYQFRSTGYGFEKNNGSWSMLTDFIYPSNDGETAFCYASFPDNNGVLVTFKPVDYTTFLNTTEENVCAMQYVSESKGVLFFFKPKAEYGYNVDGTTLKVGTTAVNNAWLVIKTREVEYEKTINNKIKTYAGGSLVFIPDENISSYASNPIMDLNTFHYGLEKPAEYTSFNINDTYEGKSGVVKYKVTAGLTQGLGKRTIDTATGGHGIISSSRETPFPNVVGTKGVLLSSGGQQIQTEELFGYTDVYEEMTESYYLKKFSDYVTLSGDWLYSVTRIGSSNGALWEFRIPVSELEQTPAYNSSSTSACILTSSFAVASEDSIRAIDSFNYATYGMSFTYTESADYVRLLIAQNYLHDGVLQSCKKAVDASQLTFKYLLAKYEYKYNVDKLFIENGEQISFNLDDGKTNYKDISLSAPSNNKAAVDMLKPITTNINDLNYKIENIEAVTTVAIGKGDGKTDDTAALQAAINSVKSSNGVVNSVVIPSGHYLISSPLIIATDNVTIRGEGEVVLEASATDYRLPLIVSMANDVTIENLILKIGYNADDPQYTAGYNKLTDSDPSISHEASQGLHCGIWLDSANTYNSLVNNGEINPYLGYYRNKVKNCTIIGGYRYSVKKTERSYGIYNPDSGFQYFDRIENVNTYNLYCGIRLGDKASSCYVDFHFDSDINNRGGATSINRGGCRFGMISRASYGNIKCYGQSIGGDVMPPIYYDESGNELKMENCPKVRKQLVDISTGNLVEVYTDDGWTDSIMTYPTLSEVGMAIYGRNNYIYNMIYDAQRSSDGLIYFGVNSAYNEVYLPTGTNNDLYGANETTYLNEKYYRKVAVNDVEYYDVVRYDIHFQLFTDLGIHNCRSEKSIENRDYPFVGDMGTWARDEDGSRSNIFAKSYGMQDNFLSFVDRWGTVSVTQGETSITKFDSIDKLGNEIEVSSIGDIFATNSDKLKGFATGLTFKEIPTEENPIIIDITFDDRYTAISSGFIQFNDYIAKSYSVALIGVDGIEKNESIVNNNHNAVVYYKPYNISNGYSLPSSTCKGIRIKIYEGMKWTTADGNGISNPNGKVGISYIFMANANAGGKSYLPLGGGTIYGDLTANVDEKTHKLSEKANSVELERIKYYGDKDIIPSPESYFTVSATGDTITGLTDDGKAQTELVIPYEINGKKVLKLADYAFKNNTTLKSVKIPSTVTYIGEETFAGCAALQSVDILDSVHDFGIAAFNNCTSLKSVHIPNGVASLNATFSGCTALQSIHIPNSVTYIGIADTIPVTTTIYCEQGSYVETYAQENSIPIVYTDIKSTTLDNKVDKVAGKSLIDKNVASRIQVESSDNSLFFASTETGVGWKYTPGPERLEYLSPIGSPMTLTYAPAEGLKVVDEYGSADITVTRSDGTHKLSEKSEAKTYTVSVPTTSWTEKTDTDNQKYYYKKITVSGMTASGQAMTDVAMSDSVATARKEMEAFQCISRVVTGSGYIEMFCFDEAPTTAFTLRILVLGRQLY